MVKVGIVGTGNMGKNHIRLTKEMHDRFELCAVYDPDESRVKSLEVSDIATASEEELIDKCDAVIIAAPSSLHKQIALKAASAGKHLLVEKPLSLSTQDANEIVEAYKNLDRVLMVGHVERFNSAVIEMEKVLQKEEIIAVNIERCSSKDNRIKDTDVVYDLMIHDVDILLNAILPNNEIVSLSSAGTRVYSHNYMDYVQSLFKFDNGVVASIVSSRATEDKLRRIDIHCKNSFIKVDLLDKKISILKSTVLKSLGNGSAFKKENMMTKVFVPNIEPLRAELKHFGYCIENKTSPITCGKSAVRSIEVLDIIKGQLY
ncbi:Gfo/Idh/MocA family protein [Butyrivibrio sp. YAB3001]|uniref:Gfo/Idh/MocA family protein n=1 Tax=Butyrivibrio sp. YAB3001 TaxID=1520812 RepID=UPI0008F6686D|nr:Gfo/Idh/MocA family oxidoreductase [Butyrivibrio sp. YAB3001]SFB94460.1 Oxidoreductase family, NAD-binding Rossmann fold [Butyrivibrio sp. YAB3001]